VNEIRNAQLADLDGLIRLEHACFPPADVFSSGQYRALLSNPRAAIRLIGPVGSPVAAATVLRRRTPGGLSARLYSIAVHPDHRGQGFAKQLLADAIALCRRDGVVRLRLEVRSANESAIALYRKFGFTVHRHLPDYYEPGEHGVKMVLELGGRERQEKR
jgi:ribosomal protein S18 acetylase RimI-like enzyme